MKGTQLFNLQDFIDGDDVFYFARTTISSDKDLRYHYHDFAEIIWIKEGRGKHIINGHEIPIQEGSLSMIRPKDTHTLKKDGKCKGLVVTNIAFAEEDLNHFKDRYFRGKSSYFTGEGDIPFHMVLNNEQLNDISSISDKLLVKERSYLHLDHMLIHIFEMVTDVNYNYESFPHWLSQALEKYNTPEYFNSGVLGFVELTGRSPDHVNRTVKRFMKQTITDTINKLRLEFATRQLVTTNTPIKIIAVQCGYTSINYFHRVFKQKYGYSPQQYRKRNCKVF